MNRASPLTTPSRPSRPATPLRREPVASPGYETTHVIRCRSIHEIDANHWDSINAPSDGFHSHRFIRCVEDARVENSEFWYLLFYRGDTLIGTAALAAFHVALDVLAGGTVARVVEKVRGWRPDFMRIRVLFCGLPISLGQSNLVLRAGTDAADVLPLLVREMTAIGTEQRIRHLCIKELPASRLWSVRGIERHGFFRANSLPYVTMDLAWPTFDAYLASLRHGYRRPIRLSLQRLGSAAPVIQPSNGTSASAHNGGMPRLVLGGPEVCPPERMYQLYSNVMRRARVKLETLNLAFFETLYANLDELELLALVQDDEVLGCALLTTAHATLTFMLVGLDYDRRDEYDVYFNLIYGIIALAIERGCARLQLGQTSYWLKQRIGGDCVPEYMYFRSNRRLVHTCLRLLRSRVFPVTSLAEPRVFRRGSV